MYSLLIFISVLSITVCSEWNFNRCPSKCHCSLTFDKLLESHLRTVDCSAKHLTKFPKSGEIPTDAQVLLLQDNQIRLIPDNMRLWLPELLFLNISNNRLTGALSHQQAIFEGIFELKHLDLSHNKILILPDHVFQGLFNLVTLDLSFNRLSGIMDNAFVGLQNLEVLRMDHNQIGYVNNAWFRNVRTLNTLRLNDNNLNIMQEDVLSALHYLKTLDLSNNHIFKVDEYGLHGLSQLETLDLSNNRLDSVPAPALSRIALSLKHVDMSRNPIFKIRMDDFANMPRLVDVSIKKMQRLRIIDRGAFKNLESLVMAELHDNPYLAYIDSVAFVNCPSLAHLMLHNNNMSVLDKEMVDSLPALEHISFYGNILSCDCNSRWIKEGLRDGLQLDEFERMVCASPQQHKFKLFSKLDLQEFPKMCAPRILYMFDHVNYRKVGEDTSYDCRAVGVPKPKVIWVTPEGQLLTPSQFHPRRSLRNGDTLVIHDVRLDDAGMYTCIAESQAGSVAVQTYLNITQLDVELGVTDTHDTSATLFWKGVDRTDNIFQLVYYELENAASRKYAGTVTPIMKTYTITNLHPDTIYEACIALEDSMKNLDQVSCVHLKTEHLAQSAQLSQRAGNAFMGVGLGILVGVVIILCLAIMGLNRTRPARYDYDNLTTVECVSPSKSSLISVTVPHYLIKPQDASVCSMNNYSTNDKGQLQPMDPFYNPLAYQTKSET